jgi:nitrate reductase gamma subunit
MDLYALARGPFAWVALSVFVLGSLFKILSHVFLGKREKILYPAMTFKNTLRSILHGIVPFGAAYMRKRPVFTIVTFVFHCCLFIIPFFLLAHVLSWDESWQISWWSISDSLADKLTILVILCGVFFLVRRLVVPEARKVTQRLDWLLLAIVMLPFLTGFLAYHQWGPYKPLLILHILSGELLLIAIPFSRLSHMLLFVFTRGHMGSEFGKVLESRDW